MNEQPAFSLDDGGTVRLSGNITLHTAGKLYGSLAQALDDQRRYDTVDLANVAHVDSAALALLLEWKARKAHREGGKTNFRVINSPSNLLRLAQLCEAVELLEMTGRH